MLTTLLNHPLVTRRPPADAASISAVQRLFNHPLPPALLDFWHASAGCDIPALNAELLGPTGILQFTSPERRLIPPLDDNHLLPFLDDHESNLLVLALSAPLAPRVLWFPHDDDTRILFRDPETFTRDLTSLLHQAANSPGKVSAHDHYRKTPGDYPPDAPRTTQDNQAALALMNSPDPDTHWPLATQLLDASELPTWEKLLNSDLFTRRAALTRMQAIPDPSIQDLLRRDESSLQSFTTAIETAAREAGLTVAPRNRGLLIIDGRAFDPTAFYPRRNTPRAIPRTLAWVTDILHQRDPRRRPDNLFAD